MRALFQRDVLCAAFGKNLVVTRYVYSTGRHAVDLHIHLVLVTIGQQAVRRLVAQQQIYIEHPSLQDLKTVIYTVRRITGQSVYRVLVPGVQVEAPAAGGIRLAAIDFSAPCRPQRILYYDPVRGIHYAAVIEVRDKLLRDNNVVQQIGSLDDIIGIVQSIDNGFARWHPFFSYTPYRQAFTRVYRSKHICHVFSLGQIILRSRELYYP